LKALEDEAKPRTKIVLIILASLSGLLAWQAKQEAITLPAFLGALLWLRSRKRDLRYVIVLGTLPLLLAATMWNQLKSLFATVMDNAVLVNAGFDRTLQPGEYFRTYVTSVVGYYLPRFVWPVSLSADPQVSTVEHWYSIEFIVSLLILAALGWLMIRAASRNRLVCAGLAALLVSPLAAYAFIPLADVALEHRAYIPGLAIALLSAALFKWAAGQFQGVRIAAPVIVVILLTVMTIQRNPVFANNVTLWEDAVQKSPDKARTHFNVGAAYQTSGRLNDAIREYQVALSIKPDIHSAYSNMAAIQIDSGQFDEGEKTLVKLTQIAPDYPEGFINLSVLYLRKQETDKAIAMADRAITINPESFGAHFNRGEALTQKGDYKGAVPSYERAAYLRPDLPSFQLSLAHAYQRAGDSNSAEQLFVKLTATNVAADAWRGLAGLYRSMSEDDKAIDSLKQAIRVRGTFPDAHHDLGIAYMKKGMTDAALDEFKVTVSQSPSFGPGVLNLALAYQTKGDLAAARQVLEAYVAQFGNKPSEYLQQIQGRLAALRQAS
jgi:tetratricopeptide (TPR) repeat protein